MAAALPLRPAFALALAASVACALHGLVRLADEADPVAQQVLIGAVAQAGRTSGIAALAHLTMLAEGWAAGSHDLVLLAIAGAFTVAHLGTLGQREQARALTTW